jgi:prepilin-type N-terminal cleavage/methylation domain-containing protein
MSSLRSVSVRAFGLIEVLVVVIIVLVLAAILLPRYMGGRTPEGKTIKAPVTAAKDTVCRANLTTVRQSIAAHQAGDPDGKYPVRLMELRELTPEFNKCPVGGEPYLYDPQTGQVRCPHPGHGNF